MRLKQIIKNSRTISKFFILRRLKVRSLLNHALPSIIQKIQFRNKKLLQNVTDRLVLAGWRLPINAARAIYYVGIIYNLEIQLEKF